MSVDILRLQTQPDLGSSRCHQDSLILLGVLSAVLVGFLGAVDPAGSGVCLLCFKYS